MNSQPVKEYHTFDKKFWIIFIIAFVILIVSLLFLPYIITTRSWFDVDFSSTGQVGDTIGGILSPFVAIAASILTFMAFYIQYIANKEQRLQFGKQADDTVIERFENRFFELIRLHRDNIEEQNIQNIITGRKCFSTYYFELRYIYILLEHNYDTKSSIINLSNEQLTNLAYLIFFFGVGHITDSIFIHAAPDINKEDFLIKTIERLEKEKEDYLSLKKEIELAKTSPGSKMPEMKDLSIDHKGTTAVFKQIYQPFTGHGTKIGHYYRHLFQTVKYVETQTHQLFTDDLKYSYVKILRAQISNFEQVLLYYNSISVLGNAWNKEGYIKKYKLITNLPLSFVDFGEVPQDKYKDEIVADKDFFDWYSLR